jgi:ArsR family transcriptional regulator, arsenate/arsenite/antimonite-responsive transcriptional repressor
MANDLANDDQSEWGFESRLLRAIAHPIRLKILAALCEGSLCVNDVNDMLDIPQPQVSQHMAALRKVQVVACHTNGPLRCYYILKPTLIKKLIRLLSEEHPARERNRATVIREANRQRELKS